MNLEAKVGQENVVVNVENAAAIQNDDVTLPLKQNANFELYDVCVFFFQMLFLFLFLSCEQNFRSIFFSILFVISYILFNLTVKDYQQKPLSSFLSSILNFNSLIPATKDIQDENNGGKKPKAVKVRVDFEQIRC